MKFTGIVKKNLGRGLKLGFPTANIAAPNNLEDGLYVGLVQIKKVFPALIFIGEAKTYNETNRQAEVYILDFSDNLYDKEIFVELIKKIRDNQKFDSEERLVSQMKLDEKVAREFFTNYNLSN